VAAPDRPLAVEAVDVGPSRIEAIVRVGSDRWLRTAASSRIAERTVELLPGITRHRCECGSGIGIAQEIADTETPHLLEHVALELMVLSGSPRTLRGDTRWDFATDGRGVFHVLLDYDDDLVALGAVKEGEAVVTALLEDTQLPDVDSIVARLSELRRVAPGG
jgi:hypothetical protein